jgi:hypothetical protein
VDVWSIGHLDKEFFRKTPDPPELAAKHLIASQFNHWVMHCIRTACTAFLWEDERTTTMTNSSASDGMASAGTGNMITDSILANKSVGSIRQDRTGVVNACDHCGGRFGMVTYRCWGNKFCKRRCKDAFVRELGLGLDGFRRWFSVLRGAMILRFWTMLASSSTASAQP